MRYLLIALLFTSFSLLNAQISVDATIEEVTVFRQNAELTNTGKAKLPAGTSEVIIKNISTYIDANSLQVRIAGSNVTLLSAKYENNFVDFLAPNEKIQALKDELEELEADLRWEREQKQIYVDLETTLNKNRALGGTENGYDAAQLATLLEIYKAKQYEYNLAYIKHEKAEKDFQKEATMVRNQLNEANAAFNKPSGILRLQVSSVGPVTANFECSYLISGAGWQPNYDLRSEGTDQDVTLNYKANIYQNSGYNWDRVDMIVSTGNPSQNNNRPILNPLYVDFYVQPGFYNERNKGKAYKLDPAAAMNMAYDDVEMDEIEVLDYVEGYAFDANTEENQLNVSFELSLPQSIPSDGNYHLVGMESYELASDYIYHAVPKKNSAAFLLAKVTDWGQYSLLPGTANIFFEGGYVGQSHIDPNQTSDTLLLSMGRDEGVKVKRKQLKDFTSTKFLGGNRKETYAFEIEVRNTKGFAIDVEILDQIPVSNNKEIIVELIESSEAEYNEEIGKLKWDVILGKNETKKFKLVYSVKYPKDKKINM